MSNKSFTTTRRRLLQAGAAGASVLAMPALVGRASAQEKLKVAAIYTVPVEQQWVSRIHIAANAGQTTAVSLRSMRPDQLGRAVLNDSGFDSLGKVDVTSRQGATDAIRVIDRAIDEVAVQRGDLGAFQKDNLESNLNYLRVAHEELTRSESVIRDADMAEEMMQYTRNQVMMQAGTAMLAQANMQPSHVLSLLT